jgi:hypothetical protein
MLNIAGSREGPYEMLEPDAGKLASPVLRGRGGGNIALLPGHQRVAARRFGRWCTCRRESKQPRLAQR